MNVDDEKFEPHEFQPDDIVLVVTPYSAVQLGAAPLTSERHAAMFEEVLLKDPDLRMFLQSIFECMEHHGLNGEVINDDTILLFGHEESLVKASFELDGAYQTILCNYKTYCEIIQKPDDIDPMEIFDGPHLYH